LEALEKSNGDLDKVLQYHINTQSKNLTLHTEKIDSLTKDLNGLRGQVLEHNEYIANKAQLKGNLITQRKELLAEVIQA